jgi:hypothetical protein
MLSDGGMNYWEPPSKDPRVVELRMNDHTAIYLLNGEAFCRSMMSAEKP